MRVPISWLKTLVKYDISTEQLAEHLTMAGIEVDAIEKTNQDEVLTLAILANIARCLSMRGVANEISALLNVPFIGEALPAPITISPTLNPKILDKDAALRLSTWCIENIRIQPSPAWMQDRLRLAGINPINNVVDATNYVLWEYGQPTHAYDADRLPNIHLVARFGKAGEKLLTLAQDFDAEPLTIPVGIPVIVSADQPVAIAGVVGGRVTAIHDDTTRILLEAACFPLIAIRRAQTLCKTYTDASARFSRGVDPRLALPAVARIVDLLRETCPDLKVQAMGDAINFKDEKHIIALSQPMVVRQLGFDLSLQEIAALLTRQQLICTLDEKQQQVNVTVDLAREDLQQPCDLLEEVVRLYGYDKVPLTMPIQEMPYHPRNILIENRECLRDKLVQLNLQEVMSYSMSSADIEARLVLDKANHPDREYVQLLNPISEEKNVLRRQLLPALLQHVAHNYRHQTQIGLFEIGKVFLPECGDGVLPAEPYHVAIVLSGHQLSPTSYDKSHRNVDFYDMSRIVSQLFSSMHWQGLALMAVTQAPVPGRPGQTAAIIWKEKILGYCGVLHDVVAERFDISALCIFAELDLTDVLTEDNRGFSVASPVRFPSISIDLSLTVPKHRHFGEMVDAIYAWDKAHGDAILQDIALFDEFQGKTGEAVKAWGIRLALNAKTRTLTMEDVTQWREKMIENLASTLQISLKGAL